MKYNRRDFLSSMAGLAAMAAAPSSATTAAGTFQQAFDRPPAAAKPWVRWWWPGGVVMDDELRREIRALKLAGFGGAEIQAFNPAIPKLGKEERTRVNDYANDAFWTHMKTCTDEAQAQGLRIDSTFGSAWPSGGGFAVTPELALLELTPAFTSVRAPLDGPIRLKIPGNTRKFGALSALDARTRDPRAKDWPERLAARQKLVAVVAFQGTAPVLANTKNYRTATVEAPGRIDTPAGIVVTDKLRPDGVLDWVPPADGDWQIVVFKQFAVDSSVMGGVGEGPQLVLDHFNRAAFAAHAQRVGAPLAPAGKPAAALRATFIDSLELMPDIYWSEDLLAQFRTRRGYDLTPYLPHLLQPGWMESWNPHMSAPYFDGGEAGERVRADYRLTLSDLMIENLWQPFVAWNHAHGLQARFQAHGATSDLLRSYGMADIPETEDLGSGDDPHFPRLARAAADLYGRALVSCESLCWPKQSFQITPAQWLARVNLLFASGVNAIVMHGFPYALHRDAWPGWYPFAPSPFLPGFSSMINEANPLWGAIGGLNDYIARTQAVLQGSRNVVPVAVYFGEIGHFHGIEPKATDELLQQLLDHGYDYDRINDDSILHGRVAGGALRTAGGASYSALVLPARAALRAATAARLVELAEAGLRIFFVDRPPSRDEGYLAPADNDRRVREAVQAALTHGARIVAAAVLPAALAQGGVGPNLTFIGAPCVFIEKTLDGRTAYLLHNQQTRTATVAFTTRAAGHPQLWNAFDGSRVGVPARRRGGQTEVSLEIPAGGAALVVFAARPLTPAPALTAVDAIELGRRGWTLAVTGHGAKGRTVRQDLTLERLRDWAELGLADVSGQGAYNVEVTVPAEWLAGGHRVWLELGVTHDMATVAVNGATVATLIAAPFEVAIGGALRTGSNRLTITVANSPNNAMIDPKAAGLKDLTPQPAGLLGPVRLVLKRAAA